MEASANRRENIMERSMITDQALINQSKPGSGQEPTNIQRRALIGGALLALLSSPGRVIAKEEKTPKDPFVLLLNGPYQPVAPGTAPDLGLSSVNLNDGTYSTTKIFPVHVEGIACNANENTAIGNFYVQFGPPGLAAYQLPGGAIAMQFIPNCGGLTPSPDGLGGVFLNGTLELNILEATGVFGSFKHGHNHMVDRLHQLANNAGFDEYCFCFITRHG
jgi:hypothetical protein